MSRLSVLAREQTPAEERANGLSHAIGAIAAVAGMPILIVNAVRNGGPAFITGCSIFAASIFILYLASALYHLLPAGKAKEILRVFDHSSIFLLIAGTYTPFTLGILYGAWGWSLFGVIWGLAVLGIVLKLVGWASHEYFSTALYLLMGWLVIVAIKPMISNVPLAGLLWLLAGGLFYTIGIAFYATDAKLKFGHFIWHLFVLGGTICHFFSVLWYAMPK